MSNNSAADLLLKSVPAFNISRPYDSMSTPAIAASSFAILTSSSVQVGDLNNKVSATIADNINPAISLGIATSFSLYNLAIIVFVHPTGSAR